MADPLEAARNVDQEDRQAEQTRPVVPIKGVASEPPPQTDEVHNFRVLVAKGLISDLVTQIAKLFGNRYVSGPEEERLKEHFLEVSLRYASVLNSGPASLGFLSPNDQAAQVEAQSKGLAAHRAALPHGGSL